MRWELARQIRRALKFDGRVTLDPEEAADKFVLEIPNIYRLLKKDIEAIYEGDPAAASREEVNCRISRIFCDPRLPHRTRTAIMK